MYGDFGNDNAQSLPRLQQEIQRGKIDAVLHVGDMAYDLATVSFQINRNLTSFSLFFYPTVTSDLMRRIVQIRKLYKCNRNISCLPSNNKYRSIIDHDRVIWLIHHI